MKIYRSGRMPRTERPPVQEPQEPGERRERPPYRRRLVFLALLALFLLLLVYVVSTSFFTQRAVLLGSDARPDDEASRSDTIMVAAAGTESGAGMLSVPRDTLVEIPGHGEDKINAAFAYGGPELTVETLEDFTGRRIGNYAVIHFEGVEDIVNAMGGITIDVREPLNVDGVNIPAGRQTLNGEQALAFVRYRGGPTADIGRIERQQQFLQAAFSEATSPSSILNLPGVVWATWGSIDTNMNPVELAIFGTRIGLSRGGMTTELYPGMPQYIDGISYWVPDTSAGQQVVAETID
jgi:LCP family protein required for cell wall assembly